MKRLNGYAVLIVEPDLDVALALQDSLAMDGARVLTAYGVDRAMQHAETTDLSVAVVGKSLCTADRNFIFHQLSKRKIPIMMNNAVNDREEGLFMNTSLKKDGISAQLIEAILGQPTLFPSSAAFDVLS
jgi:response regulator RpfG family c-di-GMP phosphodiesterase